MERYFVTSARQRTVNPQFAAPLILLFASVSHIGPAARTLTTVPFVVFSTHL
jgi:hypothetical protein